MIFFDTYSIAPIVKADYRQIHELMTSNNDRFARFFPQTLEANLSLEAAKTFAALKVNQFKAKEEFLFVVKRHVKLIGLIYIKELNWHKRQGELAYCIDANCQAKGVMSTGVKRLSAHAFTTMGLNVLQIITHKENLASIKVAVKAGFSWQATLPKAFSPPNEAALDMELYKLTKES